jgi:peptidyl-prolyl cis-trans isomerase B (cyclophilin B)
MKLSLSLLALLCISSAAFADDVALLQLRFPSDKSVHNVAIELYEADAPATVENFKKLAKKGFYDGCAFHRAFPNTLVQTGDPLSKKKNSPGVGTGGPGYTLPAEIHRRHTRGAVAAARLADNVNPQRRSNGSQFYVCLAAQPQLDGQYTVFGNVIQGLDVLEAVSNKPTDTNDAPVERVLIRKLRIVPRENLPAPAPVTKPASTEAKPSFFRRMWPW